MKPIFVALFGIAAGLTVIWYTAQFQALYFLQNARTSTLPRRSMVGIAAGFSMFWFVLFGWLSDKIGRKLPPIVVGYALTIVLMFPLFHWMASAANPERAAMDRNPVVVQGSGCNFNPFAQQQETLRPRSTP